ncbi:aspartate:alanine exchanger family transporter [Microbacterium sp. MC2]
MSGIFAFLQAQPSITLFLLVGLGAALGRVRVRGISLGAVGVLFAAIALNAWAVSQGVTLEIPAAVGDLGVIVFAFCTGVIAGPGFFNALKSAYPTILVAVVILLAAAAAGVALGSALGVTSDTIAGTFAGAMTNTPALAATGGSPAATVGYASAYVYGVVGAMVAVWLALRHSPSDTDTPAPIIDKAVRVDTTSHPTVGDLARRYGGRITVSRMHREDEGSMHVADEDTELTAGAVVNVVGPRDDVDAVTEELGHTSTVDVVGQRSTLDYRRIIVSRAALSGRTIASLGLREKFGASIVRIRRGDVDLVATPDAVVQQGDRLRVVGPKARMPEVSAYLGDSERGTTDTNPVALGLGVTIGLLVGVVQIPLPGGGAFTFGFAAGALIIGLVLGRVRRIGAVSVSLPITAATVIAEFGLLVFLAFAGIKAGSQIVAAITSGEVVTLLGLGAVMTTIVVVATYLVLRHVFALGGTRLSGALGGAMTNPALLAFAQERTHFDPRVALGYSLIYPAAMVVKIVAAQIIILL